MPKKISINKHLSRYGAAMLFLALGVLSAAALHFANSISDERFQYHLRDEVVMNSHIVVSKLHNLLSGHILIAADHGGETVRSVLKEVGEARRTIASLAGGGDFNMGSTLAPLAPIDDGELIKDLDVLVSLIDDFIAAAGVVEAGGGGESAASDFHGRFEELSASFTSLENDLDARAASGYYRANRTYTLVCIMWLAVILAATAWLAVLEGRRREVERKLILFSDLIDRATDPLFIIYPANGRFIDVNEVAYKSLGYSRDEILQIGVRDIAEEMDDDFRWDEYIARIKEKGRVSIEGNHVRKDGTTFPVEVNIKYVTLGGLDYMVATARDVTERVAVDNALRLSEARYRDLTESLTAVVYTADVETWRATYVSRGIEELYGYTADEWIGDGDLWTKTIHPDDMERVFGRLDSDKADPGAKSTTVEYRITRKDGKLRWVSDHVTWKRDDEGRAESLLGVRHDITWRKEAELSLQGEILTKIAEGTFMVRASDAAIVYTNPTFDEMLGYEEGELIGEHVSKVNAPTDVSPEEVTREVLKHLAEKGAWCGEIKNIKKDGTPLWTYTCVSSLNHHEFGDVWVSVKSNITGRNEVEEGLGGQRP